MLNFFFMLLISVAPSSFANDSDEISIQFFSYDVFSLNGDSRYDSQELLNRLIDQADLKGHVRAEFPARGNGPVLNISGEERYLENIVKVIGTLPFRVQLVRRAEVSGSLSPKVIDWLETVRELQFFVEGLYLELAQTLFVRPPFTKETDDLERNVKFPLDMALEGIESHPVEGASMESLLKKFGNISEADIFAIQVRVKALHLLREKLEVFKILTGSSFVKMIQDGKNYLLALIQSLPQFQRKNPENLDDINEGFLKKAELLRRLQVDNVDVPMIAYLNARLHLWDLVASDLEIDFYDSSQDAKDIFMTLLLATFRSVEEVLNKGSKLDVDVFNSILLRMKLMQIGRKPAHLFFSTENGQIFLIEVIKSRYVLAPIKLIANQWILDKTKRLSEKKIESLRAKTREIVTLRRATETSTVMYVAMDFRDLSGDFSEYMFSPEWNDVLGIKTQPDKTISDILQRTNLPPNPVSCKVLFAKSVQQ